MHKWLIDLDIYIGISRWREQLFENWNNNNNGDDRNNNRCKGIWDTNIERQTLILNDGRKLTYFIDGPTNTSQQEQQQQEQIPYIFCFHAMFLSGNCFIMEEKPYSYILVCINRPGYYGSDIPKEYYTYDIFVNDIYQLADHLNINKFYVVGHSSGGPCALACAAYNNSNSNNNTNRILGIGILAGDPEYAEISVPDKRLINTICLGYCLPYILKYILCCLPIARNAVNGLVNDYILETTPYPFRTEDIIQRTIVYLGENDHVLPYEVARHVPERLQNVQVRIIKDIGHLSLLRDEILHSLFHELVNGKTSKPIQRTKLTTIPEIDESSIELT